MATNQLNHLQKPMETFRECYGRFMDEVLADSGCDDLNKIFPEISFYQNTIHKENDMSV